MPDSRRVDFAQARFDFDFRALERQLEGVAKRVFPQAAARFLNGIAFDARDRMKKGVERDFDRPNNFTKNAFTVVRAKESDRENMFATIEIKDEQAKYLAFQVFGGTRGAGDPGAGRWDVQTWSSRKTKYGGVDRRFLKRTAQRNRDEKAKRKDLRARRQSAAAAGLPTRDHSWVKNSRNRPGVFFGTVDGVRGYWERPKRTKAARVRKRGVVTVRPEGNNRPKPLVLMQDRVTHKPFFRYDWYVRESFRVKGTRAYWDKALKQELRRR